MFKFFSFFQRRKYDYTHWDIHALARILDPIVWQATDAKTGSVEQTTEKYLDYPELQASCNQAMHILKRGDIFPTRRNLYSSEDVKNFQLDLNIARAEHVRKWGK